MIDSSPIAFWTGLSIFLILFGLRISSSIIRWKASPKPVAFIGTVQTATQRNAPKKEDTTDTSFSGEFFESLTAGVMAGAVIQLLFIFLKDKASWDLMVPDPWYGDPWALAGIIFVLGRQVQLYIRLAIRSLISSNKNPSL